MEVKMSSCVEFEGKAVDNAVQKASDELNISKEQLKYKVISYGSSGIFGLVGVKKAKISVILPKKSDKAKSSDINGSGAEKPVESVSDLSEEEQTSFLLDKKAEQIVSSIVQETFENAPYEKPEKKEEPHSFPQEAIENGREALQRIVDFITTDASISIDEGEDRLFFNVTGGNAGVLIGKRGQTLEAIQYLVEKIINKKSKERIRIQIDVEDYLDNRKANLESLANRLAEKTRNTGKPSTIGQMNAHDRRIIHLSLKDAPGVRTQSIGDGFYRKLVIFPKRKNYRKKKK